VGLRILRLAGLALARAGARRFAGREAQDHELADIETGGEPRPGLYPADDIENREGDITPDAPDPRVEWDTRVQPERADEADIEKEGT
jgi:hypothetical protein